MPIFSSRPPDVEGMKARRDEQGLINALNYRNDAQVRRLAALYLRELKSALAVPTLCVVLRDSDAQVRGAVAHALSLVGDGRAIVPLANALPDPAPEVRVNVAKALNMVCAHLKPSDVRPPAPPSLFAALKDPSSDVRSAVASAIAYLRDPRAADALVPLLADANDEVRHAATSALGSVGSGKAVEPLLAMLRDPAPRVRSAAAESLGSAGARTQDPQLRTRVLETLVATLQDPILMPIAARGLEQMKWQPGKDEAGARFWASRGDLDQCREIGAPAVPALADALKSVQGITTWKICSLLADLGDPRAVPALLGVLVERADIRDSAARALEKLGWKPDQSAQGALYWVGKGNAEKCAEIGEPAIEPLLATLKGSSNLNPVVIKALGKLHARQAVEPLLQALPNTRGDVFNAILLALGEIGDPRALQPLTSVVLDAIGPTMKAFDPASEIRLAAVQALGLLGDRQATDLLVRLLKIEPDERVDAEIVRALGRIGDPNAVEPLIHFVEHPSAATGRSNEAAQRQAIEALGMLGDQRAIAPIVRAVLDYAQLDKFGSQAAGQALRKLGSMDSIYPWVEALRQPVNLMNYDAKRANAIEALKAFSGQNFGTGYEAWRQWWTAETSRGKEARQETDESPSGASGAGTTEEFIVRVDWNAWSQESFKASPDNRRVAFATRQADKWAVVVDGKEGQLYDGIRKETPVFSPDSRRLVFIAQVGRKHLVVADSEEEKVYDDIASSPVFSPDGRRLAYVAVVFDTTGAAAYKRRVVIDKQEEAILCDDVWGPSFSPDSRRVAYAARVADRYFFILDGTRYDGMSPLFSPDSRRVSFLKKHDRKTSVVVDEESQRAYDEIEGRIFSPDSRRMAYAAKDLGKWRVVLDGHEQKPYDFVANLAFSPDSERLSYAASEGAESFAVFDGQERKHYDNLRGPRFSPDGENFAYEAKKGTQWQVVISDQEQQWYDDAKVTTFSIDGRRWAYHAKSGDGWRVVVDGQEQKPSDTTGVIRFSPDSGRICYLAQTKEKWRVVVDGEPGKLYPNLSLPVFSPDSRRVAYSAVEGDKTWLVVDGKEVRQYDALATIGGARIAFTSVNTVCYFAYKGNDLYRIESGCVPGA